MAHALAALSDSVSQSEIEDLENRAHAIIDRLREEVFAPDKKKNLMIRFPVSRAADMVGRTPAAIREAEKASRLPKPSMSNGRRTGYSLPEINRMREIFGTRPWRAAEDEPVVLGVQNFKGGVGKSTLVCHAAQYFALRGYRVLVVDCDSQASTTTLFGVNPDLDVKEDDTLLPFLLHGRQQSLDYAMRDTYWDGITLIPSNLTMYNAEYAFAARLNGNPKMLDRLRVGIEGIQDGFDIILLDPPPALGMISLSVLQAANALIIPVPPSTVDFSSTCQFFTMLRETLEVLRQAGMERQYKFLKVLATKANDSKSAHLAIGNMMRGVFGNLMFEAQLKDSAEIDNANVSLMTVYELEGPSTSRDTHRRCRAYLDAVNREIELQIRKTWPSHRATLSQQGLV